MSDSKVIIVDDYESMRDLLRQMLTEMGITLVAETGDGEEACRLIVEHKPDLVILDMILPGMDGFAVASQSRSQGFSGAFLILTSDLRPYVVQRIYEMKFAGALSKSPAIQVWREGIQEVLAGRVYRCPVIRQLHNRQTRDPQNPTKLLTKREREILSLIGLAKSNEEIGPLLGISPDTVKGVRQNLMHKLELRDTPQLVRFAQEQGYAGSGTSFSHLRGLLILLCLLGSVFSLSAQAAMAPLVWMTTE